MPKLIKTLYYERTEEAFMKVCSIQPPYPYQPQDVDTHQAFILRELDQCDDSLDLILLPECCNAPTSFANPDDFLACIKRCTAPLLDKAAQTARRCHAFVGINLYMPVKDLFRNTTVLFNREGEICARYEKQHLPLSELRNPYIDHSYLHEVRPPYTVEIEGIRFGFLTCYDCYFNELIARMADEKLDIVLMSAYQRGERADMLETEVKNIAYQCNAFAIRSSVSMGGSDCQHGANSMVAAPDGVILGNLGQQVGRLICEFDPHEKYVRCAGFGQEPKRNELFIAEGRVPWNYRASGPAVMPGDAALAYPRVCAHRGFNTIAPENTLPAFGAAVALGAVEIEMDIWPTRDHRMVICHDRSVDRTSDGHGFISDLTWDEIKRFNIGAKYAPEFNGLRFPLFEEALRAFSRQTIINLHIKSSGKEAEYNHDDFAAILDLIHRYDMQEHVYIAGVEDVLRTASKMAPDMPRCALDGKCDFQLVKLAKEYGCQKIQLFRNKKNGETIDYFNQEMIDEANAAGIHCNLFWSDDPLEAEEMIRRGVSTILTNDYLRVASHLRSQCVQK